MKPVLATNVGAMNEKIKHLHNGYLIEPKSSKQICDALIDIFDNNLIDLLNTNLTIEKDLDSWHHISEETYSFYAENINRM